MGEGTDVVMMRIDHFFLYLQIREHLEKPLLEFKEAQKKGRKEVMFVLKCSEHTSRSTWC